MERRLRGGQRRLADRAVKAGVGLAALAVLVCVGMTALLSVNVPFWDDWDLLGPLISARWGHVALGDLWHWANEHRPVLPRVVALLLSWPTSHDVRFMLMVSRGLEIATLVVLARLIPPALPAAAPGALLACLAALLFSATRYETWLWPVSSVQWSVHGLACAGVAAAIGGGSPSVRRVLAAGLLVLADGLGMSTALAPWLVGLASLTADARSPSRWRHVALWLVFGMALAAILGPPLWAAREAPRADALATATLLVAMAGSPLAYRAGLALPVLLGLVGLAAFAAGAARAARHSSDRPWIVLGAQGLGTLLLMSAGRAASTDPAVMPARYTLDAALVWMAVLVLLAGALRARRDRWLLPVAAAALAVFAGLYLKAYVAGWQSLRLLADRLAAGRAAVLVYEDACDEDLARVYPDAAKVRRYARALEHHGLGPFAGVSRRAPSGRCASRVPGRTLADRSPWAYEGTVEHADCERVTGWAADFTRPRDARPLELWADGLVVARGRADRPRADGMSGFEIALPASLRDARPHVLAVRFPSIDADLPGGPHLRPLVSCAPR